MIDSHAHLDALDDPHAAVERARDAGVTAIVAIGSGLASARATLEIAAREEGVSVALGIHPHHAGERVDLGELRALVTDAAVAVGEVGLDFFRDYAPRDAQRRVFEAQLELASELERPAIVHTRAADQETLRILDGFAGSVVLHCFSSPGLLPAALERGYYVSFAGNLTYPKAEELRAAAMRVPADRLLVETDTPHLAPQPVRGKPNEPAHVGHIVAALALARGEDAADVGERTAANAVAVFGLRR